jgi:hypothetical protein
MTALWRGVGSRDLPPWCFAAFLCAIIPVLVYSQPAEPIREVWRRPLAGVQAVAVAPDGSRSAVVTWAGEIFCWTGGRLAWKRAVPGATAVVLGPGGRALVYTPLDLLRRDLVVLGPVGNVTRRVTAGSPITAVALSANGRVVAIGEADGSVEVQRLEGSATPLRLSLPGPCGQLAYGPRGTLAVTSREPASLTLFAGVGRLLWRAGAPPGCEFQIGASPGVAVSGGLQVVVAVVPKEGTTAVGPVLPATAPSRSPVTVGVRSTDREGGWSRPGRGQIQIVAFSGTGKPLWWRTLEGRNPQLSVIAATGVTVIAYERSERRGLVVRYDRVLVALDRDGAPSWGPKGGMVYNPLLVSVSPGGEAVLSLCSGDRFWLLSGHGQPLWSYRVGSPVRLARASADGSAVAVTTLDGQLSLLKISAAGPGGTGPIPEREARRE